MIDGRRRAASDLPAPGGPMISRLWPPAAATSSAYRRYGCPRRSARSGAAGARAVGAPGRARGRKRLILRAQESELLEPVQRHDPRACRRGAASSAFGAGTAIASASSSRAASAIARTPGTGLIEPSSASSPASAIRDSGSRSSWPDAASSAAAIARSKPGPVLRRSAGARLAVIRCIGNLKPELTSADRTRSRDSLTAGSGSPTSEKLGSPALSTSAST